MNHKFGLVLLMILVSGLAITVNLQNPVNGDFRTGFLAAVAVVFPDDGCRAYRGNLDVFDSNGVQVASNGVSFRGLSPSEVELKEDVGQGIWSGYWDGSNAVGLYNITMTVFEDCSGVPYSDTGYALVQMEAPIVQAGLGGTLQRTASVATSVMILVFGTDLAQVVNANTATTLIDEFGGLSFALLLFGFVIPFILSFAILYDMFFLVGFFRPNTARLIAFVIALMFSRANGFGALYSILFTVFASFWISMLSLVFMMMILWWVLGHLLWGYKFSQEINRQTDAISYLDKIGKHLQSAQDNKGGKGNG